MGIFQENMEKTGGTRDIGSYGRFQTFQLLYDMRNYLSFVKGLLSPDIILAISMICNNPCRNGSQHRWHLSLRVLKKTAQYNQCLINETPLKSTIKGVCVNNDTTYKSCPNLCLNSRLNF